MLHVSSASTRCLRSAHSAYPLRIFLRGVHNDAGEGPTVGPAITPRPQPTVTSEDGSRSLRVRKNANSTLPLPPIMDPLLIASKNRFIMRKDAQVPQEMTEFQKKLASNVHALALTTHVRHCAVTRARLPSHFLLSFSSVWSEEHPAAKGKRRQSPARISLSPPSSYSQNLSPRVKSYALNRRDVLGALAQRKRWIDLVNARMMEHFAEHRLQKSNNVDPKRHWSVSETLADEALDHLRIGVVWRITELLKMNDELFVPLDEGTELPVDTALLLVFDGEDMPLEQEILSYDLRGIGGESRPGKMPKHFHKAQVWAVRKHRQTSHMQLRLERLRAYQAADRKLV